MTQVCVDQSSSLNTQHSYWNKCIQTSWSNCIYGAV